MAREQDNTPFDPVERLDHEDAGDMLRQLIFRHDQDLRDTLYNEVAIQERVDPGVVAAFVSSSGFIEDAHAVSETDIERIRSYYIAGCCVALSLFDIIADKERIELEGLLDTNFVAIPVPSLIDLDRRTQMKVLADSIIKFADETLQSTPLAYKTLINDIQDGESLDPFYSKYIQIGFGFTYGLRIKNLREAMLDSSKEHQQIDWDEELLSLREGNE